MRLEGKVALITGSASALQGELMGFGGAAAWLFVREGAKVALTDINDEVGRRAVSELVDSGADAIYLHLDVTSEAQWKEAVQATISVFGRLDILVNNAGTGATYTVEETTEEVWDAQMAVHAKGMFLGTKHAIPEMRQAGGGSVINVSSINGLIGSPTSAAYHAAKGAVRLFTKAAAIPVCQRQHTCQLYPPGVCHDPTYPRDVLGLGPARCQDRPGPNGQGGECRRDRQRHSLPGLRRVFVRHRLGGGRRRWGHRAVRPVRGAALRQDFRAGVTRRTSPVYTGNRASSVERDGFP